MILFEDLLRFLLQSEFLAHNQRLLYEDFIMKPIVILVQLISIWLIYLSCKPANYQNKQLIIGIKINPQTNKSINIKRMINGYDQQQLDKWRANLYDYEKQKRTKKPFGRDPEIYQKKIVHSGQVKQKQRQFDPILQRYSQQRLQRQAQQQQQRRNSILQASHMKASQPTVNYDIVNLHPYSESQHSHQMSHQQWSRKKNINNPIRNVYNIINGQQLPSGYYRTRKVKLENDLTSRKIYNDKLQNPQFDIVKAQYRSDNQEREIMERRKQQLKIREKMEKNHKYDNILQRYYNPEQQWQYQQQIQQSQLQHGKNYHEKLPPSYRNRQPFVPSFTQQQIKKSPALRKIIEKEQNNLRNHQLRYAIEEEYKRRNEEDFQKQEKIIKNRVHEGKILQTMAKEYDIINNKLMEMNRSMMYDKKLSSSPYSYDFLKHQKSIQNNSNQHNRSISINERSQYNSNEYPGKNNWPRDTNQRDNWDTRSNAYSERSRSSAHSESRRYSIKSGGFN